MFKKDTIEYECSILPRQLGDKLDTLMLKKAKDDLVNKCTGYGFIKQIFRIQKKSDGLVTNNSDIIFTLFLEVLVCNPQVGDEIECDITDKDDRIGKPMMKKEPLLVIIFSEDDNIYEIGDTVVGRITDKRIDKTNNMINLLVDVI
jgi:hypothetical protein